MINYHKIKTNSENNWDKIIIPSNQELNIYRRLLLKLLLHGHKDISDKICNYINEFELNDIKYEYYETHFYNWLNNDLILRNTMGTIMKEYYKLQTEEEQNNYAEKNICNSDNVYSINKYETLLTSLGLTWTVNDYYRRSKSLTECFNSQWWKTTEKQNNIKWNDIHFIMSINTEIQIYKYDTEDIDIFSEYLENYESFRNPTIKEKFIILEYILECDDIYSDLILIEPKQLTLLRDGLMNMHTSPTFNH